jgi:DNA-binding transcriptional ArsR family regulator
MTEESFILLNLKDSKAKKMAQVISNETSRKILEYLTNKEATETQIAKALNIPASTVHYNLKHLKEVNLVKVDQFHYSEKGKVVDHYKLSNKYVIIAPETPKTESIKEKLKKILPVVSIAVVGAGIIHWLTKFKTTTLAAAPMMAKEAAVFESDMAVRAAPVAANIAPPTQEPNIALWFLIGSISAVAIYLIVEALIKQFSKR